MDVHITVLFNVSCIECNSLSPTNAIQSNPVVLSPSLFLRLVRARVRAFALALVVVSFSSILQK